MNYEPRTNPYAGVLWQRGRLLSSDLVKVIVGNKFMTAPVVINKLAVPVAEKTI